MGKASKPQSTEEKPKREVAQDVITPKKRYFYPEAGRSVEADSRDEADKLVTKKEK